MRSFTITYLDTIIASIDRLLNSNVLSEYDIRMFRTDYMMFHNDLMQNTTVPFFAKSRMKQLLQEGMQELTAELHKKHTVNYLLFAVNSNTKKRRAIREKLLKVKDELIDIRIMILSSLSVAENDSKNSGFKITTEH